MVVGGGGDHKCGDHKCGAHAATPILSFACFFDVNGVLMERFSRRSPVERLVQSDSNDIEYTFGIHQMPCTNALGCHDALGESEQYECLNTDARCPIIVHRVSLDTCADAIENADG